MNTPTEQEDLGSCDLCSKKAVIKIDGYPEALYLCAECSKPIKKENGNSHLKQQLAAKDERIRELEALRVKILLKCDEDIMNARERLLMILKRLSILNTLINNL